jgi:hypothetical protein
MLHKIPLGPFIEILTDLFENGADFIDLSGDENNEGETPRDTIKITVNPEYLSEDIDDDDDDDVQEIDGKVDFLIEEGTTPPPPLLPPSFSDEDIADLI